MLLQSCPVLRVDPDAQQSAFQIARRAVVQHAGHGVWEFASEPIAHGTTSEFWLARQDHPDQVYYVCLEADCPARSFSGHEMRVSRRV